MRGQCIHICLRKCCNHTSDCSNSAQLKILDNSKGPCEELSFHRLRTYTLSS